MKRKQCGSIPKICWGQSQLVRCKKCTSCRVTVLHFSSSPTHPTTHLLPQEEDDQDYLFIDKESRLVNNSDSTRTIHQTTSLLFHQVGRFGPKANMLFDSQYFFCLKAVCRSSKICCPGLLYTRKCGILIIYHPPSLTCGVQLSSVHMYKH